jgi:hypothetical protein
MSHHPSWLDRAADALKPQPGVPAQPHAPLASDNQAWKESVEQHHVVPGLTVHGVGLSVFGETRSLRDRLGSNEPIDSARQKIAHAMINDAELSHHTGKHRNKIHDPVEPSGKVLRNADERAALESSMHAAREAYLSGHDPTKGAIYFFLAKTPSRVNKTYSSENKIGVGISTQSGPYHNSFPQGTRDRARFG